MPSILSKNCIMEGEVEWYCLACSALLPAAEDTLHHIHTAEHKHNLTELAYADNYSDDYIRKGRGVYYCEVCNVTFPTAAKVGLHVTRATHVAAKTRRQLKRAGTAIVFQENTLITESAWNGLVDDTCVLCNVEFDDQSTHKSQLNHILNLINSSVMAGAGNDVYRKIDDGYQCLTCNKVVPGNMITEHLDSTQHKSAFLTYDGNKNKVNDDVTDKESIDGDRTVDAKPCKPDEKTLLTTPVLMNGKAAGSSDAKQVEILAKQHGLSMNKGGLVVYCSACSTQLTATLDRIKEHVDGKKHKKNLAKQSQEKKENVKKVEKTHFQNFKTTKNIEIIHIGNVAYAVINNFILNQDLYFGICEVRNKIICQICGMDLNQMLVLPHINSHIKLIHNCMVITSLEDEFVRELKSDLYQCGFCGHVESDLEDMMEHLKTDQHLERKAELARLYKLYKMNKNKI